MSRVLHWGIAALLAWQFGGMLLKYVLGRIPLMKFWVGTHGSVGTLLLVLILVRVVWALSQHRDRPLRHEGLVGLAARIGHVLLYIVMLGVPALAVLRMLGGTRPISLFGLPVRGPTSGEIEWMTAPANALHGTLAWVFLALIVGHVAMVFVHRFVWRDDVLARMAGREPGPDVANLTH